MKFNKISIIVPVYNARTTLEQCIISILEQSYKNIELILINNGSTDNSLKICKKFEQIDKRIIVVDQPLPGVSLARNAGLTVASGEYIQFVDSDDYIKPNMCETLLNAINQYEADIVICGYDKLEKQKIVQRYPDKLTINYISDFKDEFSRLLENSLFNAPWNKLYKKDKIKKQFKQDLAIGEDLLFNLTYFSNCNKIITISDCLYVYNTSSQNNLSTRYFDNLFDAQLMLHDEVKKFFMHSFDESNNKSIDRVFAKEIYYYLKKLMFCSNESRKSKINKINNCTKNNSVQDVLYKLDSNDFQIKILCFLLRKKLVKSIYAFFKMKEFICKVLSN